MRSRTIVRAAVLLALGAWASTAAAQSFHFTVTADMRGYHTAFGNLCEAINGDPTRWQDNTPLVDDHGVFHVSVGDVDDTIPENRAVVDAHFGGLSAVWYPIIGNHERETSADMTWLRDEYDNGNGPRTPLKNFTNQDGPLTTKQTTYSWDHGNAHFVALNEYWDGTSDTGTDGDIVNALGDWLAADLAANTKPFVFVFGHEPAFPLNRHVGDSLDKYPANRDAFWDLLEGEGVQAYFCGHTHYYSKYQTPGGSVWQLDVGNAGNDPDPSDGLTFVDIVVSSDQAVIGIYRDGGTGTFSLYESMTVVPEPVSLSLMGVGLIGIALRKRMKRTA